MAELIEKIWMSDGAGLTRRDRRPCTYHPYIPDRLERRDFRLSGETAADVADAEAAIMRLNREASTLLDMEALARILLRAESVASSWIEGLTIGARRLLRAEAAHEVGLSSRDVTADEVLGNINAMVMAVSLSGEGKPIKLETLCDIHRRLLGGTPHERYGGVIREEQNWIGGSAHNPCAAQFVPPPHEHVRPLLEDLCEFCNGDSVPAVVQAAIAHAQFETIHPFVDGNGRAGRALIHLILRRRGLAPRVVPPVSLILATYSIDYLEALTGYRYIGDASSEEAYEGLNRWVSLFAGACSRAVEDANRFEQEAQSMEETWRARLGKVRSGSSTDLLLRSLAGIPILTVNSAARLLGRTFKVANMAVDDLVQAGILRQITIGRRNRAFEAPEVIAAFTDLERRLASPLADTRVAPPTRSIPARHQ